MFRFVFNSTAAECRGGLWDTLALLVKGSLSLEGIEMKGIILCF